MAVASKGRAELVKQWKEREMSPERRKVWTEPKPRSTERKVPVVYYLSRNGHLEHPHFMEVPLSSSEGLYLRDVINRLNFLRGKGMASMYSWSSKRSYKNGYVWHDLSEDDFIYPAHGHEYVLKGSELPQLTSPQESTTSPSGSEKHLETAKSMQDDSDFPLVRRKKTAWSSLDLTEYKVYKTELTSETAIKAADAATQTDDKRQRRRAQVKEEEEQRSEVPTLEEENPTTELGCDEISPPPSSSSPDTLDSLIKADGRLITSNTANNEEDRSVVGYASGRMRASAVLMHLISCGSISVKDHGYSLAPQQYRARLRRAGRLSPDHSKAKDVERLMESHSFSAIRLEDKEYFSGSLIETKKKVGDGVAEFPVLKRSSSYNADRGTKLEMALKEIEGVRAKCIPRKPKTAGRREGNATISRSAHGSKRINDEPTALKSETTPNTQS